MLGQPAFGTQATGLALLLLVGRLEGLCLVVLGVLERALVCSQAAVGGGEVLLETLGDVVERDGVWGEVEGRLGLLGVLPQLDVLGILSDLVVDLKRRRVDSGAAGDELRVPTCGQLCLAFSVQVNSRPAISHARPPFLSWTLPLISYASLPRHVRGLKVKTHFSPVRWLVTTKSP